MNSTVVVGYHIEDGDYLALLAKEVTYKDIVYTLNDPINNYTKLVELLEKEDIDCDFLDYFMDYYRTNDESVLKNVKTYDDMIITAITISYKKNTSFFILSLIGKPGFVLALCTCSEGESYEFSDSTMEELKEWKNQLLDSGRIHENPKFSIIYDSEK